MDWTPETLPGRLDRSTRTLKARLHRVRQSGTQVAILLTCPFSEFDVPQELAKRLYLGQGTANVQSIDRAHFRQPSQAIHDRLRALAQEIGAGIRDPAPWMCGTDTGPAVNTELRPPYLDQVHLRENGIPEQRFAVLDRLVRPFVKEVARPGDESPSGQDVRLKAVLM